MTERNVVLVTYDSLRADHIGHLGYERDTTPNLDELASEGTTFENAIAPASRTNPSMSGILSGEPMVVRDRVANPEHSRSHLRRHGTLAERLKGHGYTTGAFNPNAYASSFYGFDRGFDHFEDFLFDNDRYRNLFEKHLGDSSLFTLLRNVRNLVRRQEAFKTWDSYVDEMVEWAESQEEPFFLWAFSLDTHFPHLMPREYREWSNLFEMYYYNWRCNQLIDAFDIDLGDRERQKIIDIYDDSILFADALLAELRERLDDFDPIFVVHGDHGEAFDEHGVYGHFYPSLYEENVRVPFVVSEGDGDAVERPVSLTRLPDVVEHVATSEDGETDLTDFTEDWVAATDYDGRFDRNLTAIRTQRLKYVHTTDDTDERGAIYDLEADATEQENLVGTHPADEPLEALTRRRVQHEGELLAIDDAVESLGGEETHL